jgi:DNA-binding transcriptional regulator YhcF (GntR family)
VTGERISARDIQRALIWRISNGVYHPGEALPSVRKLAEEFSANRNTVNKACQELRKLGILEMRADRRSPVVTRAAATAAPLDLVFQQVRDVIWQAMLAGVTRRQLLTEVTALIEKVYGESELQIRFLECNPYDSATLSRDLSRLTGVQIEAGLLDELQQDVDAFAQSSDLIVTTFHHLAGVLQTLAQYRDRVVGVDTRPSSETLLRIARLTKPRIGLVCTLPDTARSLKYVILSYQPGTQVATALIDAPDDVRHLAETCDHLLVTYNCVPALAQLTDRRPDVVIEFRIDDQSVEYLRERIREARLAKAATHCQRSVS